MILPDEKSPTMPSASQPPPPYMAGQANPNGLPPFPHCRPAMTLSTLPSHLLLQIVHMTFPQTPGIDEGRLERQRKTLYWMSVSLRLVNRALYIASMHILRSTYLPAYDSLVRSPYSSDPFPLPTSPQSAFAPPTPTDIRLGTIQRETATLDLFIALKVREDVWLDDSELHLERDESFKDIFDLTQPRSRLEDLVRVYGVREGVITTDGLAPPYSGYGSGNLTPSPTSGVFRTPAVVHSSSGKGKQIVRSLKPAPLQFSSLSVSFSPRRVGLVLTTAGKSRRTIVETERTRDERLESAAKRLVRLLTTFLDER
ncbi:hypothetical protein FB45DRAFT_1053977 [Roridomyces roridus]|uniref:Uncharacterized protein n=1 Tax=Roridomyces roridus TaxID=1738132 RepID=A0AAD7C7Z2_9AGAR|nr:hypothetical protein FB45DRAFT_1053977 [Roridomyces roridus]